MTATAPLVKMAACPQTDGEGVDSENTGSASSLQVSKLFENNSQVKQSSSGGKSKNFSLDGEKAYDEVARLEESALRNLLEEVTSQTQSKNDKSAIAQKEEEALREESGSGEDTIELALGRPKKKRPSYKKDQNIGSHLGSSASSRNNTGGSLGSLHNISETKAPPPTNTNPQGVASRSRAGGSCGNLSKSSFETHAAERRKNRRSRDINKASTSQREGGSLQNLSKSVTSHERESLQKSGSLSQVFTDVGGSRIKNRRQKTSSESSGRSYCRRSEDREAAQRSSSEEEVGEYPYQRLGPSSHSSGSGLGEPTEASAASMVGGHWNEDPVSDVASGETTEEDGESLHVSARSKLGEMVSSSSSSSRHHHLHHLNHHHLSTSHPPLSEGVETELLSVISHTAHRDILPTISSDSEIEKPPKFNLSKNQEEPSGSTSPAPGLSYNSPCVNSVFEGKSSSKEEEIVEKRKLRSTKSDGGSFDKSVLDENGNPILMSMRSSVSVNSNSTTTSISSLQPPCNDRHSNSLAIGRRNGGGVMNPNKEISMYSRLKAKQDKRKAYKEKDVMPSEKTPGFRGDDSLDAILKFLGADDTSNSKGKKKNKGKKDDAKEDKDPPKKSRLRSLDKSNEEMDLEKVKLEDLAKDSLKKGEVNGNSSSGADSEKKKDDEGKRSKKGQEKKKKKGSGSLRESSSVEDLVSKSKQSNCVKEVRKQVTVDDGDVSLVGHSPYRKQPKNSMPPNFKSEFSYDFYQVGDALQEPEPSSTESGDFEVVNRRKGRRSKNSSMVSQGARVGGSGGWSGNSTVNHNAFEDQRRFTFPRANPSRNSYNKGTPSQDKPHINFTEGPYTMHDGAFLSQFSGNRSAAGERYTTTTSAPHSEDSDSDGDSSVQSMPAKSMTPRPDVRKPPPSSDSTPQTSYANIAKLAATANKAQMKKSGSNSSGGSPPTGLNSSDEDGVKSKLLEESPIQEAQNESTTSILDDNFPPLAVTGTVLVTTGAINTTKVSKTADKGRNMEVSVHPVISQDVSPVNHKRDSKVIFSNSDSVLSENVLKVSPSSNVGNNSAVSRYNGIGAGKTVTNNSTPASRSPFSPPPQNAVVKPIVPQFQATSYPAVSTSVSETRYTKTTSAAKVTHNSHNTPPVVSHSHSVCNNVGSKDSVDRNKNPNPKEGRVVSSSKHSKNKEHMENGGSRNRHFEAAVIFADNAKFDLSITGTGIEFGFDLSLDLSTLSDQVTDNKMTSKNNSINDKHLDTNKLKTSTTDNKNLKNLHSVKRDFSKLYQAPTNDAVSYNYEELCRHVYRAWESTLRLLEEDPKSIQYWKAARGVEN